MQSDIEILQSISKILKNCMAPWKGTWLDQNGPASGSLTEVDCILEQPGRQIFTSIWELRA